MKAPTPRRLFLCVLLVWSPVFFFTLGRLSVLRTEGMDQPDSSPEGPGTKRAVAHDVAGGVPPPQSRDRVVIRPSPQLGDIAVVPPPSPPHLADVAVVLPPPPPHLADVAAVPPPPPDKGVVADSPYSLLNDRAEGGAMEEGALDQNTRDAVTPLENSLALVQDLKAKVNAPFHPAKQKVLSLYFEQYAIQKRRRGANESVLSRRKARAIENANLKSELAKKEYKRKMREGTPPPRDWPSLIRNSTANNKSCKPMAPAVGANAPCALGVHDPDDGWDSAHMNGNRLTMDQLYDKYGLDHDFLPVSQVQSQSLKASLKAPCTELHCQAPKCREVRFTCCKTLRKENILNYLVRTEIDAVLSDFMSVDHEVADLESIFSKVYEWRPPVLKLIERGDEVVSHTDMFRRRRDADRRLRRRPMPVDAARIPAHYVSEPTALLFFEADDWKSMGDILAIQDPEHAKENMYILPTRGGTQPSEASITEFLRLVRSHSPDFVVGVLSDVIVARKPLGFYGSTTCLQSDAKFLPKPNPKMAALASFPRSGSHLSRLLLEKATGILTGSVYRSPITLAEGNLGEVLWLPNRKHGGVLVYKDHSAPLNDNLDGEYKKVILLVRNPIDSVFSFFHYLKKETEEDEQDPFFVKQLRKWGEHYNYFRENPLDLEILLVKYEDLVEVPEREILRMLKFLEYEVNPAALKCAVATSGCDATPAICRGGHSAADVWSRETMRRGLREANIIEEVRSLGYCKTLPCDD